MMPAWKYRPASAAQRRRRAQSARAAKAFTPAAPWDAGGVVYDRLDASAYLQKTLAALSPHDVLARATLTRRLQLNGAPVELDVAGDLNGSVVLRMAKEQKLSEPPHRPRPSRSLASRSRYGVSETALDLSTVGKESRSAADRSPYTSQVDVSRPEPSSAANAAKPVVQERRHPLAAVADALVVASLRERASPSASLNVSAASATSSLPRQAPRVYDARLYSPAPTAVPAASSHPERLPASAGSDGTRRSSAAPGQTSPQTPLRDSTSSTLPLSMTPAGRQLLSPVRVSARLARTLMLLETPPLQGSAHQIRIDSVGHVALDSSILSSSSIAMRPDAAVSVPRAAAKPPLPPPSVDNSATNVLHHVRSPLSSTRSGAEPSAPSPPPPIASPLVAPARPWANHDPEDNRWEPVVGTAELCASSALFSAPSSLHGILARYETRIRAILGPDAGAQELAPLLEPARLTAAVFEGAAGRGEADATAQQHAAVVSARGDDAARGDDDTVGESLSVHSLDPHASSPESRIGMAAQARADSSRIFSARDRLKGPEPEAPLPGASELRAFESASTLQQPGAAPQGPASRASHRTAVEPPDPFLLDAVTASLGMSAASIPPLRRQQLAERVAPLSTPTRIVPSQQHGSAGGASGAVMAAPEPAAVPVARTPADIVSAALPASSRTPVRQGSGDGRARGSSGPQAGGSLRWLGLPVHIAGTAMHPRSPASPAATRTGRAGPLLQPDTPVLPARNLSASLAQAAALAVPVPAAAYSSGDDADALYEPTPVPRAFPY